MATRLGLLAVIVALLAGTAAPGAAQSALPDVKTLITPQPIAAHVRALAVDIGARPAGSEAEAQAADYVAAQFESWGYTVTRQPFEVTVGSAEIASQNVIATLPGAQEPQIVVGAHLDSVEVGTGADDNASGVAVMLAAAEVLAARPDRGPVAFVAFGAEEVGLRGSRHFVAELAPRERAAIRLMVNIDTVGIGDHLYVYAGAVVEGRSYHSPRTPGPTWARDLALATGAELGHAIRTSPAARWDGFTGPWSDHYPFAETGIAVAYFERWNWEAGDDPNWGQETAARDYLHTAADVFANVEVEKIEPVAEIVTALIILAKN